MRSQSSLRASNLVVQASTLREFILAHLNSLDKELKFREGPRWSHKEGLASAWRLQSTTSSEGEKAKPL